MPFGKYKGIDVREIPDDYLEWVWRECTVTSLWLKRYLEQMFGPMPNQAEPEVKRVYESQTKVMILIDGVMKNWGRRLTLKYHPDRGGSHEQMLVVNEAVESLKKAIQEVAQGNAS